MDKLGKHVNIKTGKLDANASSEDGIYPFFTCSREPLNISSYSYDCECVLVAGNGDLNVKYYNGKFDAYQRTYIIESLNKDKLDTKFLYYFMEKNIGKLRNLSIGGIIKYIKLGNLTDLPLPLFDLNTQHQIAATLDKASKLIAMRKKQLQELDALAEAVFYDMFGDPVTNEKGWEKKKMIELTTKIGSGATPKGGNAAYKLEGINLIRSLNVHNREFHYKDLAYIDEVQAKKLNNVIVQENDILLNITGASVARCCIVPKELIPARVNQHVAIIRVNSKVDNEYLAALLTNNQYQEELLRISKSNGATREALTKNDIEDLEIIFPPLSLQTRFATIIEKIEAQKSLVRKALQESEDLFQRLMQDLFNPTA